MTLESLEDHVMSGLIVFARPEPQGFNGALLHAIPPSIQRDPPEFTGFNGLPATYAKRLRRIENDPTMVVGRY